MYTGIILLTVLCIIKRIIIRCSDNEFGINATFVKIYNYVMHLKRIEVILYRPSTLRMTLGHNIYFMHTIACTNIRTYRRVLLRPNVGRMPLLGERDNNSIIKRCVSCRSLCEYRTKRAVFPSKRIAVPHIHALLYIYIYTYK